MNIHKRIGIAFLYGMMMTVLGSLLNCRKQEILIADLILINGVIHTVDSNMTEAQAVAIKNDRILAVGSDEDIATCRGEQTRVIDLKGRFVCPGFNDAHVQRLNGNMGIFHLDLTGVTSTRDIGNRLRRLNRELPKGVWIVGYGWDQSILEDEQWPTKRLIDNYIYRYERRPVFLYRICGEWKFSR